MQLRDRYKIFKFPSEQLLFALAILSVAVDSSVNDVSSLLADASGLRCHDPDGGPSGAPDTNFAVPGGRIRSLYVLQKQRLIEKCFPEVIVHSAVQL
jgi:hypothetical protein